MVFGKVEPCIPNTLHACAHSKIYFNLIENYNGSILIVSIQTYMHTWNMVQEHRSIKFNICKQTSSKSHYAYECMYIGCVFI